MKKSSSLRLCVLLNITLFFCQKADATHLRAGEITLVKISGASLDYQITLRVYTRNSLTVKFEGGTLDFGDANPPIILPKIDAPDPRFELLDKVADIGQVTYTTVHTFPGPGFYTISYFERNLNAGILNLSNSVDTPFYIETNIVLDPSISDVASATFGTPPVFKFPLGREFSFSTAPIDTTNRVYFYELITPFQNHGTLVSGYKIPASLKLNSRSGMLTWDTKFLEYDPWFEVGQFLFEIKIHQYNGQGKYLGSVTRAFTVIIEDNPSLISVVNPITDPIGKVLVEPGNQRQIKVLVSDSTVVDTVFWEPHFSPALSSNITFTQYDSVTLTRKMKVGLLTITSTNDIERNPPYQITLRAFSSNIAKDISFLFFTKDVELQVVTAIQESNTNVNAYPNPCINELFVSGVKQQANARFYNALGQMVSQSKPDDQMRLDTSPLSAGIYFLVLTDGNQSTRLKVIKK